MRPRNAHLSLFFLLFSVANPAVAESRFMGLGDLDGGDFFSEALAISGDGSTIVGRSESASGTEAFIWTDGSRMVGIGDLPGGLFSSKAVAVSQDGSVITGQARSEAGQEMFRWTAATGMVSLGPATVESFDGGISNDGTVIVGTFFSPEAFRWTQPTGQVGLGFLPGLAQSFGTAVSGDGSIVVGTSGSQAFRWTQAGGMVGLGGLEAEGISSDGVYIVGSTRNEFAFEPFRWDAMNGMIGLGPCPVEASPWKGADVSVDGSVVVGGGRTSDSEARALIWDEKNGCRLLIDALTNEYGLDLEGWTLYAAPGISDDGRTIVGFGENPLGQDEAWMAVIGPATEPVPTLGIVLRLALGSLLGGAGLLALRRLA